MWLNYLWSMWSNPSRLIFKEKTKLLHCLVFDLIQDDTYTALHDYACKLCSCFHQKHMKCSLSCEKNWDKIWVCLRQTSEQFSRTTEKWINAGRKTVSRFLVSIPFPPSPLSASLWAWKHLNTKFSELFWHSSLCVMTSDSSGDKLKSMSVSAWVFTNPLSGTAFQFWKHYYMQVAMNNRMYRMHIRRYSFEINRGQDCKGHWPYISLRTIFGVQVQNLSDVLK